jgi:hypothetical protein
MSKQPTRTPVYFDLLKACHEPGCLICRLSQRAVQSYVDGVLYESVNDPDVQAQIVAARGYCNQHAWLLPEGQGRSLGVAILQRAVLKDILAEIGGRRRSLGRAVRRLTKSNRPESFLAALKPRRECPVCQQQASIEQMALSELLKQLNDPELLEAFRQSAGLCVPHFRAALQLISDDAAEQTLLALQGAHLKRLHEQLSEFIRKNDYRFAREGYGVEGDSWLRAIGMVSGQKGTG